MTCYVVYAEAEDEDEFEKWQTEIKEAEAQVEASEFGGGGVVGEDFERPSTPPDGEEEFTEEDGTVYKWDKSLRAYVAHRVGVLYFKLFLKNKDVS